MIAAKVPAAIGEANTFRVIFFILTFFSIGILSNFKKLWADGIGKLAAVYLAQPVRLRDLGGPLDLVAVLRRRQAAAGQLIFLLPLQGEGTAHQEATSHYSN